MYSACDHDGNEYLLFDFFVDYKKSDKACTKEGQAMVHNGKQAMRRMTAGWHLCVQWLDGSTSWQSLKELKESYPLQVAEYAVMQGINDEPAFNWWVNFILKKREQIIKLVKKKSNSIAYHVVRESVAMGESLTGHVWTNSNPADLVEIWYRNYCIIYMMMTRTSKQC
jgi:hypothetical protein